MEVPKASIFIIIMPCPRAHGGFWTCVMKEWLQSRSVQQTSLSFDPHSREVPHVRTSICNSSTTQPDSRPWVNALDVRHGSKNDRIPPADVLFSRIRWLTTKTKQM